MVLGVNGVTFLFVTLIAGGWGNAIDFYKPCEFV